MMPMALAAVDAGGVRSNMAAGCDGGLSVCLGGDWAARLIGQFPLPGSHISDHLVMSAQCPPAD